MEISKLPGLDKLCRTFSEVLTVETCSICLQKLEETVLLWPCAHWFCHGCIKKLHLDKKGNKIMCPLCNGTTSRRSILPFEDKQKEYEDLLQTLIGAISLDMGFDITSYNIHSKNEVVNNTNSKPHNAEKNISSAQKGKINDVTETKDKPKTMKRDSKRVTRSRTSKSTNSLNISHSLTPPCKPPETPKNYKEKKVEDWLTKTRFSMGEQDPLTEGILDNSNKVDAEEPSFSEQQLKSVSQMESNTIQSPTSIHEKGNKNKYTKLQYKKSDNTTSEQFDKLLHQENKSRFIKSTYGCNSDRKSRGRCFVIDSDIFNSTGNSKNQSKSTEIKKPSDKSESPLEDFSSGSGEEWCFNKKKRMPISKKRKLSLKDEKNTIASMKNKKVTNMKNKNKLYSVTKKLENQDLKGKDSHKGAGSFNSSLANKINNSVEKNTLTLSRKSDSELNTGIGGTVKEIINDWDNTSEINCKENHSKQLVGESDQICTTPPSRNTAAKHSNFPSPGWSRLTRTKKEFNVSERKKLSLNKTNTTEKSSISNNHETSKQSPNLTDETPYIKKLEEVLNIEKLPVSKIGLDVNQSFSSTGCTSFKGFEVPVTTKKRDRDSGFCNASRLSSPERKKVCRDVEVQTSPSRMQACIKEYLRKTLGEDVEQLLSKDIYNGPFREQPNVSILKTMLSSKINFDQHQKDNISQQNICSQDSDKENVALPINNIIYGDRCIDSDFVLGTEDTKTVDENKHYQFNFQNPKTSASSNIDGDTVVEQMDEVDPDAVTQPYDRTPVAPKTTMKTSTGQLCSAVSNPTDSELKKVNEIFLKNDIIYPEHTPVSTTSWNDSGIVQLEKSSVKLNTIEERKCRVSKSQKLCEKTKRSRRQLDFVRDSKSDDIDMFEASPPQNNSHLVEQLNALVENDHFEEERLCSNEVNENHLKLGSSFGNQVPLNDNIDNNNIETSNREFSAEVSEDCFVEGTPDVSQSNLCQEEDITEVDSADFVCTLKESVYIPTSDKKNETTTSKPDDVFKMNSIQGLDQRQKSVDNINSPSTANSNMSHKILVTSPTNHEEEPQNVRPGENKIIRMDFEKQQEENSEITENTEETEPLNYCFASSLLTGDQNLLLMTVLKGLNIPYSKTVGEHISHLIVSTTNGCTKNTYKVLYAMALHKPIVRFEWVEHVLKTGGTTVSLDPFIALDPSGECGVLRARKDKRRELLQQFAIHVYNVIESVVKKEQIEELIRLCGGTVVSRLNQFQTVPRYMHRIIIFSEPPESCTQGEWRHKYSAAEVSVDWLYNTIGRYKVVPVAAYMVEQTDAVQFLLHEGYPENLIFDTSLHNDSVAVS